MSASSSASVKARPWRDIIRSTNQSGWLKRTAEAHGKIVRGADPAGCNFTQHSVDKPGRAGIAGCAAKRNTLTDRCMHRDSVTEQNLVGSEPENIPHGSVQLFPTGEKTVDVIVQKSVILQDSQSQVGRKSRLPFVQIF